MRRQRRLADPDRFLVGRAKTRPIALIVGISLLLGAMLTAAPRNASALAASVALGGAWLSLVLAMTLPRESERAGQELLRRLAQFRHELHAAGDSPGRAALERLISRARELGLRDEEIGEELAQIRACLDAIELQERLRRGDLPSAEPADALQPGNACYFVCAVRCGRRRADQFGHLVITRACLKFRGPIDVSVAWSDVASVRRDGRELIVEQTDSRRMLRFLCHSHTEAAQAGVLAEHLALADRAEAAAPDGCHASA